MKKRVDGSSFPLQKALKEVACFEGLLSRWCDLHNRVPDMTKGETHRQKFAEYLDEKTREAK